MTKEIKSLINNVLQANGNWKYQLLQSWSQIVGHLASRLCIEKIDNDVLILAVHNSSLMHELYLLSPILLKKINQTLDQQYIKRILFKQIGAQTSKKTVYQKRSVKKITTVVLSDREKKALAYINDQQLKDVLYRFLVRCYQEKYD